MKQGPTAFDIVKEAIRLRKEDSPAAALEYLKSNTEAFDEGSWANYHVASGDCHLEMKEFGEAERCYQNALHHNPDHKFAHINFSRLLSLQGNHQEAELHMREAVRIDPRDATSMSYLAIILVKMDRFDEGTELIEQAKSISPKRFLVQKNVTIFEREAFKRGFQNSAEINGRKKLVRPLPGPVFRNPALFPDANVPVPVPAPVPAPLPPPAAPPQAKRDTRADMEEQLIASPRNVGLMKRLADLYIQDGLLNRARETLELLLCVDEANSPAKILLKKLGPKTQAPEVPKQSVTSAPTVSAKTTPTAATANSSSKPDMVEVDVVEFSFLIDGKPICTIALQFEDAASSDRFHVAVTSNIPAKASRMLEGREEISPETQGVPAFLVKVPT
jgi:tetratricopeptide (TPR) repeat protein